MGYALGQIKTQTLFAEVITTGGQEPQPNWTGVKAYQASGTTTAGAGAATILIQGSNDRTNWDTIGTITLVLATTASSDSFSSNDGYVYIRGNVSAISGTGAEVSATMGF